MNEYVEILSIDMDHLYIQELKNYFGDKENPTARCTLASEETVCMWREYCSFGGVHQVYCSLPFIPSMLSMWYMYIRCLHHLSLWFWGMTDLLKLMFYNCYYCCCYYCYYYCTHSTFVFLLLFLLSCKGQLSVLFFKLSL